ncbi:phytochrome A-associated F-box protein [Cicer arietinum]|uniref:Phytochrome A-associated F-box protein n=1 Tax=Cicer arietinum TaxID=3827 RepID=A0A1S2XTM9_CICAR|nr:phytochrome A-associated F-box protein [Cicer arietinum]
MLIELTDDIILNILWKVEEDPRDWARLSCVSTKLFSLIRDFCWNKKSSSTIPSELLSSSSSDLSLHKLPFCCPGPIHAGILFDTYDDFSDQQQPTTTTSSSLHVQPQTNENPSYWSLFDDLYHDTLYADSEHQRQHQQQELDQSENSQIRRGVVDVPRETKKRKICGSLSSHLASGKWNLSREQGSKLLARQFRDDCLYICDWPGCVHLEEKRTYRIFRGVFRNFEKTRVWKTVNDCSNRRKLDLPCAFCSCKHTWDLHSAFCLRRGFGFHDDGEPVVRAYVCDNGHVSGAWTDVPMYT